MKNNMSQDTLIVLDRVLKDDAMRKSIDPISRRVEHKLSFGSDNALAWEPIPLSLFTVELPEIIRSSWVFVIRADTNTGAERHPNSHQFMMSYRGQGNLQVKIGDKWLSKDLVSDPDFEFEKRWVSIPPQTWHRAVADEKRWTVVSFHTVAAEELIEERPDTSDDSAFRQMHYMNQIDKNTK